ncbi:Transient receptor potential channel,Transient receptor ion channel domain,Ion transport domain,Transient [Cinara cedri]|uniref:Transient receptor potential channel,Transient receptor ion channel domain,Ion transport domain,Transient n=1 Tax=Cinara cedri TaxID=506608 RepID=A0A5E4NT08_9HEMI|nr:Transient receptor potential channel,Transient receptor ion channel domain,Ion transport domain,Transient [Cinara cedri]
MENDWGRAKSLSLEEKKYLLTVKRGDVANVQRMIQRAFRSGHIDIDCVDSFGRGAIKLAIDAENLEMLEMLVVMGVGPKDNLLHAINVEFVEAVELLLQYEELVHTEGEPYSWEKVDWNIAYFTPDITPLILAAHKNNYEIIKMLLDRGATLPMPHTIKCGCDKCITASKTDSLRYSMCRVNEYRALASPSLMALSSADPILTAFQLSWELRRLSRLEKEFTNEYMELRQQCEQFAVDLLRQTRSSYELDVILKHDSENAPSIGSMKLRLIELAINYKQKNFVAHPFIQQLLATVWYEGLPGFRRLGLYKQTIEIIKIVYFFPFYCLVYLYAPSAQIGKVMEKPFMKFLIHLSSYLSYLGLLILASQRAETQFVELFGSKSMIESLQVRQLHQRGNGPSYIELLILHFVIGYIWQEILDVQKDGLKRYLEHNAWNYVEFARNKMYIAVIALRTYAYITENIQITNDPSSAYIPREKWDTFDPQILAEALFAASNILSALKLIHMCSISSHLGPLQLSLKRILIDIFKFFSIYSLVLFSFACGLNQLMWYFADLERKKCYSLEENGLTESCSKWKNFGNVFESIQTLFWTGFGEIDLENFDLPGIKPYTRFWAILMFATYSVINVTIMMNLLIAMMSNSYSVIEGQSDVEWKFSRTKLWLSCFEETPTLPSPYNVYPNLKQLKKFFHFICKFKKIHRDWSQNDHHDNVIITQNQREDEFATVTRALIWRYISMKHREMDNEGVTEDDVNEIKSELSTMKYDFLEVLRKNGMEVPSDHRKNTMNKKSKVWERRLMSDFYVAPVFPGGGSDRMCVSSNTNTAAEHQRPIDRFRNAVRMVAAQSTSGRWRNTIRGVYQNSPIGTTARPDSFVNKLNLQWAMNEVCTMREKQSDTPTPPTTPVDCARPSYPFQLPGRRSTLRALIDEFRRSEQEHRSDSGGGGGAPSWMAGSAAMAPGQLLKAPRSSQRNLWRDTAESVMKKSASVWYATPPAPDRPLVSRMSMPNMGFRFPERQQHICSPSVVVERIPEEHN